MDVGHATDPLNYAVFELSIERIDCESPGWLPHGVITRPKDVPFTFKKVIPVSPKDFSIFQFVWNAIELRHECLKVEQVHGEPVTVSNTATTPPLTLTRLLVSTHAVFNMISQP